MMRLLIILAIVSSNLWTTLAYADNSTVNSRAYAPENLSQLSISDQIRVIEKEYREQSRGREIPDDQLDFYLDQIKHSRWTYSKIKSDIATSLRGNGGNNGNWRPPSSGGWNATSVICSSNEQRYKQCNTPFRGRARLVENISNTRCIEGNNWGSQPGLVWVNRGCRARFIDSGYRWEPIVCESRDGRYQVCRKPYNAEVVLARQLSKQSCIKNQTWGQENDRIWVNHGCRAEFQLRGFAGNNGNGYNVTCTSWNNQYKTCAWDRHKGMPRLMERLSGRCTERTDWGYDDRRGLWVANNCSARFGVR